MSDQLVIIDRHDDVALLTLGRPSARNALNANLTQALCDAIAGRRAHARQDGFGNSGAEIAQRRERAPARSRNQRRR